MQQASWGTSFVELTWLIALLNLFLELNNLYSCLVLSSAYRQGKCMKLIAEYKTVNARPLLGGRGLGMRFIMRENSLVNQVSFFGLVYVYVTVHHTCSKNV